MEGFMFQASIYLAAAVIAVPLAARLGLGSVLGYLAAGILDRTGLRTCRARNHRVTAFRRIWRCDDVVPDRA